MLHYGPSCIQRCDFCIRSQLLTRRKPWETFTIHSSPLHACVGLSASFFIHPFSRPTFTLQPWSSNCINSGRGKASQPAHSGQISMSDSQLFDFGTGSRLTRVMSLAKKASNKLFMRDSNAFYQVHCALGGGAAGRYGNGKSRFWTASAAGMTESYKTWSSISARIYMTSSLTFDSSNICK